VAHLKAQFADVRPAPYSPLWETMLYSFTTVLDNLERD
jgi:hypothetical protein